MLIVIGFLILISVLANRVYQNYTAAKFEKTITGQNIEADKAKNEAANANANTANFDIERRTEDVVRTQTIAPKLETARRKSQNSKIELEKARKTYNETNKNLHNANASRADNCLELANLFPDIRFEDCQ